MRDPGIAMAIIAGLLGAGVFLFARAKSEDSAREQSIHGAVLRSLLSATAGLAIGVLWYGLVLASFEASTEKITDAANAGDTLPGELLFHTFAAGSFVLLIWLCVLLPITFRLPRSSSLWQPITATCLGAAAGSGIMLVFTLIIGGLTGPTALWFFVIEGGLIGAITCFCGSLLLRKSKRS